MIDDDVRDDNWNIYWGVILKRVAAYTELINSSTETRLTRWLINAYREFGGYLRFKMTFLQINNCRVPWWRTFKIYQPGNLFCWHFVLLFTSARTTNINSEHAIAINGILGSNRALESNRARFQFSSRLDSTRRWKSTFIQVHGWLRLSERVISQ